MGQSVFDIHFVSFLLSYVTVGALNGVAEGALFLYNNRVIEIKKGFIFFEKIQKFKKQCCKGGGKTAVLLLIIAVKVHYIAIGAVGSERADVSKPTI